MRVTRSTRNVRSNAIYRAPRRSASHTFFFAAGAHANGRGKNNRETEARQWSQRMRSLFFHEVIARHALAIFSLAVHRLSVDSRCRVIYLSNRATFSLFLIFSFAFTHTHIHEREHSATARAPIPSSTSFSTFNYARDPFNYLFCFPTLIFDSLPPCPRLHPPPPPPMNPTRKR